MTRLVEGLSVDLVTKAGRGGKVLAVLESARAEAREALTSDTRDLLKLAVGDHAWVVDFDPDTSTVVYRQEGDDYSSRLLTDGYTLDGTTATLTGSPTQVRQSISYIPIPAGTTSASEADTAPSADPTDVPAPAGRTPNPQVPTMGTIQVDEAEHGRLTEAAGRVEKLEAERDRANAALTEAHRHIDRGRAATLAREAAARVNVTLNDLEIAGLTGDLPVNEAGRLDEAAFTVRADEACTQRAHAAGAGRPHGFGVTESTTSGTTTWADIDAIFQGA